MPPETAPSADPGGSGSAPAKGSPSGELSKPIGKQDDAIWQKHFGKDAEGEHKAESKPKPKDGDKPKPKADAKTDKADDKAKPDPKKPAADEKKDAKPKVEPKKAEPKPEPKKPDPKPKAEPEKIAAETEDAEPANDTARARKLYEQAKATEDRSEARKLYKRAMKEAFGEIPPEFDDAQYGAIRKKRNDDRAELARVAQTNEARINEAVQVLQPAATVMRKLKDAGLGQLTMPMVERAVHVMQALRSIEDGDFTQLAEVVSRASGKSHDEAMKLFVRGVKVSPEGRAARNAAEQAEQRAARAEQAVAEMRRELAAKAEAEKTQQTEAQKRDAVEQRRAEYLEEIETELDGHAVLKLPRGKERVLAYLIKTADKTLKAPKYSFAQAADRIVAHEKRRLQSVKFLEDGEAEPEEKTPAVPGRRTVPRSESRGGGLADESPEAKFDRIYAKHTASGGRRR